MQSIARFLFEAAFLKNIPRSGYQFLGVGDESVAEHTFVATCIAFVMAELDPEVDPARLIRMCLVHDLHETRTGDLNHVQKKYVRAAETQALADVASDLPCGPALKALVDEFNAGTSREARLARDADQLAFVLHLKQLADLGYLPPHKWLPHVTARLQTPLGRRLAAEILETASDAWWLKNIIDSGGGKN